MKKEIIITTQEQLNLIKEIKENEAVYIKSALKLNCRLQVFGFLHVEARLDCSWDENRYIEGKDNCSIEGRGNCSVEGWDNCSIVGWDNCSVEGWDNCSIVGRGNCSVEGKDNCSIVGWDNCSIVGRGNCSIEGKDNCSIVGRDNCSIRIKNVIKSLALFGFSVLFKPFNLKIRFTKTKNVLVQNIKPLNWFENNGIKKSSKYILYKRVSKEFKTQEGTDNETFWEIGKTITHSDWEPEENECGAGKFYACSKPYFADKFRDDKEDKYIAIEIKHKDLFAWPNPNFPYKIAFREGKVLYEVDRFGKKETRFFWVS